MQGGNNNGGGAGGNNEGVAPGGDYSGGKQLNKQASGGVGDQRRRYRSRSRD